MDKDKFVLVQGAGGGKGGSGHTPVEDPNSLGSIQYATLVDAISEGPCVGLVEGAKGLYLNDTPLQTAGGAYTYNDVEFTVLTGNATQSALPLDAGASQEINIGLEVTRLYPKGEGPDSGKKTATITNQNATQIRITLEVRGLLQTLQDDNHYGDIVADIVEFGIQIVDQGGTGSLIVDYRGTKSGKTNSTYQWSYLFDVAGTIGPWVVTIYKFTDDNLTSTRTNDLYWSSYTEIVGYQFEYPYTALCFLKASAESFSGSLPSRKYLFDGRIVSVPSNYDTVNHTYTGIWNGLFKQAWTDNPAWVFYDIIMNDRFGVCKYLPQYILASYMSMCDKWSLYDISVLCDGLVDNGFGGQERRFTFNQQIQGQGECANVLQDIASTFNGMVFWSSGTVFAKSDYPEDAIRTLTQANVMNGTITYATGSLQERHSVALVTWYDPDNLYQAAVEVVYDWDIYSRIGYKEVSCVAYGCTSRGQAYRRGKWLLATEAEQWQVTTSVGLDSFDYLPGTFLRIADPAWMGYRAGGRIVSIVDTLVTLDHEFETTEGETYQLAVYTSDAEEVKDIVAINGVEITIRSAFTGTIVPNAVFSIRGSQVAPRTFAIKNITEKDVGILELTLREVNLNKYREIENNILLEVNPTRRYTPDALGAPTGLAVSKGTFIVNNLLQEHLVFSWNSSADVSSPLYEAGYKAPNGNWNYFEPKKIFSIDVPATITGLWYFKVRTTSTDRRYSTWVEITYNLEAPTIVPTKPTNVTSVGGYRNATVNWAMVNDPTIGYYEIYYCDELDITKASLAGKVYGSSFIVYDLGIFTTYWFWVRAVSYANETIKSDFSDVTSAVTKAVVAEDIPDQSITLSKFIPQVSRLIEDVRELAKAGVDASLTTEENRNTAAVATSELNTKVDEGLLAEAQARILLAAQIDTDLVALEQLMEVIVHKVVVTESETAPSNPMEGDIWIREGVYSRWDGGSWVQVSDTEATSLLNAITANYSLLTDVNGNIAGFGIKNSNVGGTEIAFVADRFYLAKSTTTEGTMENVQLFSIDATGAVPKIVMNGNLFVNSAQGAGGGWIVGNMISAAAEIQLGAGGKFITGENAIFQMASGVIILDSEQGVIQVKDPSNLNTGDYTRIDEGNVISYRYIGGAYRPYRSLTSLQAGVATTGVLCTLPGYWKTPPAISLSPRILKSYDPAYPSSNQYFALSAQNITVDANGICTFTPLAELQLVAQTANISLPSAYDVSQRIMTYTAWSSDCDCTDCGSDCASGYYTSPIASGTTFQTGGFVIPAGVQTLNVTWGALLQAHSYTADTISPDRGYYDPVYGYNGATHDGGYPTYAGVVRFRVDFYLVLDTTEIYTGQTLDICTTYEGLEKLTNFSQTFNISGYSSIQRTGYIKGIITYPTQSVNSKTIPVFLRTDYTPYGNPFFGWWFGQGTSYYFIRVGNAGSGTGVPTKQAREIAEIRLTALSYTSKSATIASDGTVNYVAVGE